MPKLPSLKPKDVIRILNQIGYNEIRQTGLTIEEFIKLI